MMNSENYMTAWMIYLAGSAGLFLCWFWVTRKIPWSLVRNLLRWLAVAVLFTPYTLEPPYDSWAPAAIIVLFESLIGGVEGAARAGVPLIISVSAVVILCFLFEFWLHSLFGDRRAATTVRTTPVSGGDNARPYKQSRPGQNRQNRPAADGRNRSGQQNPKNASREAGGERISANPADRIR